MKKLLLSILLFSAAFATEAQTICEPDSSMQTPGMRPRTLPDAKAGLSYSEVIQFKFPKDTINPITGSEVDIDSVVINKVEGFPAGFSYLCNKNNRCTYKGGDNGCVVIKGNPTADQIKDYTIDISATAYVAFGGQSVPFAFTDTVALKVVGTSGFYASKNIGKNVFDVKQNQPNPFNRNTLIIYNSPSAQQVSFKVFDILGHVVHNKDLSAKQGENTITFQRNNLKNGIYFYSIQVGNQLITKKMTIRD